MIALSILAALAAEPLSLAVVPIVADGPPESASAVISGADLAITHRASVAMIRPEEVFSRADAATRAEDCAGELRCLSGWLEGVKARLGVVVIVSAARDRVSLELIDAAEQRTLGQRTGAFSGGALRDRVRAWLSELLDAAGHPELGRLQVIVPPDAALRLDGVPVAITDSKAELAIARGVHQLVVTAPGHLPRELEVSVEQGQTRSLKVELEAEPTLLESPWLWIGVGAVAVATGALIGVLAARPTDLCIMPDPAANCP